MRWRWHGCGKWLAPRWMKLPEQVRESWVRNGLPNLFGQFQDSQPSRRLGSCFCGCWIPHDPYFPPDGYDRWRDPSYDGKIDGSSESIRRVRTEADVQRLIDLYDGEIAYTDAQFGLLVDELKAMGLYDDTLIVVVGDHGEAFGDHGDFVHGHLAYDEIMHVPMIMKFPSEPPSRPFAIHGAHQANGREAGVLAQLTDVAPTVLDALGLSSFTQGMQGLSLLPALFDNLVASQCSLCRNPVIRRKQPSPCRAR